MKALVLILSGLLVSQGLFAGDTFDGEVVVAKYKTVKKITAMYRNLPIVAWTGEENDGLTKGELLSLANKRINLVCQNFGYVAGSFEPDSLSMLPPRGDLNVRRKDGDRSGYVVNDNGTLTETENPDQDSEEVTFIKFVTVVGLLTSDSARYFNTVTCYK